jgi:tetratricopeptide (TPR) repeat protein
VEETTLRSLINTVKSCSDAGKRYCFILGAGASRASGIKTGAEMAKEWLEELEKLEKENTQEWIEKIKIDKKDLGFHYSKIYGRRFRLDPASGFIRLQNEMERAIPSPGYYHLAEIIDKTQNKLVLTTNFDSLTEDSLFIYRDKKALVITHESLAKYIDVLANRPTVIKLHRDILLQPKSDEADVNTLSEEWRNSLQRIMDIYVPIVIGYGGNDGGLMGFLENVASKDRIIYWCYKRDNLVNNRITKLLEEYNSFLIPIDDFDDTMHLFGEGFDCKFSEETIRQITNKRAKKLVNKYNEWTKNRRKTLDELKTLSDTESMTFNSFRSLSERNISELEKMIVNGQRSADNYYKLGLEYYFKNEYNKAIEYFTEAIKLEPDNALYYNDRGICYDWLKEHEKAIVDHSKAIELEPDNARYYNSRGICYNWHKEYEKAIADHSKAIELEPDNAEYYDECGKNYNWHKEYEKAITDHSKAIELEPDNARYYNERGICYNWHKEYEKAIADHSKAIELEPDNAVYYLDLARTLCRVSDFDNALANLNIAMSLDRELAKCYNVRGFIGLKKAKKDKTECESDILDDLSKAIELNKDDFATYLFYTDRAEYYLYSDEPNKAYNDLQKALTYSEYGRAHFFMARYYKIKGNNEEYERCMTKTKECRYIPDDSDY